MSGEVPHGLRLSSGGAILPVDDRRFQPYGRVLKGIDFAQSNAYLARHTAIPADKNSYEASVPALEALPEAGRLALEVFGELETQVGYCNGHSTRLNALEWHQSPEVDYAATPLVLLLATQADLEETSVHSSRVAAFYLAAGTAVALYPGTLHFAPCAVTGGGFRCLVALPRGTNAPLARGDAERDAPLKAVNKWMICHPDRADLAQAGVLPHIEGKNIEVLF